MNNLAIQGNDQLPPTYSQIQEKLVEWLELWLAGKIAGKPYNGLERDLYGSMTSYKMHAPALPSREDLDVSLALLKKALIPISPERLETELALLHGRTARRSGGELDLDLMLEAYARPIGGFPEDVVLDVLTTWHETEDGKWFPSASELHQQMMDLTLMRRDLLAQLQELNASGRVQP